MPQQKQRDNNGRRSVNGPTTAGPAGSRDQPYGTVAHYPLALDAPARVASIEVLNQILADTMVLRDSYKKHHWQVAGHTFYQLHLLFDKHYGEQSALVDTLAERIQSPGASVWPWHTMWPR